MKCTIEKEVITELEIQKSKFITYLAPIANEDMAKEYIKSIKKMHPKATHHCVAYIVADIERSNDDGEPASSAGLPMLQVLRGHELDYVIAVVVRYFGGTLLGVGGLIRAYGGSVTHALEQAQLLEPQIVSTLILKFPYETINAVETFIAEHGTIRDRQYETLVIYEVDTVNPDIFDTLIDDTRGRITITTKNTVIAYHKKEAL